MAIVEPGSGDVPVIEDDLYDVTVVGLEEYEQADQYSNGKVVKKLKVHMRVHGTDDGEGNEIVLDPIVNLSWFDGGDNGANASNLYKFAVALCGPQDGDIPFDTENLKGKTARATIKTAAPGQWPKVKDLMPLKRGNGIKATPVKADTSKSPSLINFMGEPDWPKFWAEADKLCGSRDKAKEAILPLVNDDLKNLESMEATTVVDLFEALKEKLAVPF